MNPSKAVTKEIKHLNSIKGVKVQQYLGGVGAHQSCLMWLRGSDHQQMSLLPLAQQTDPQTSDPVKTQTTTQYSGWDQGWNMSSSCETPLCVLVLGSHLVQCHVWQVGSRATGVLWIGRRVAVESQHLLQRKLTGLEGQRGRPEKAWCSQYTYIGSLCISHKPNS